MTRQKKDSKRPLSKSAMERYLNCAFGYDQHYNKRVRPCKVGSALVMGIAIDDALNVIVSGVDADPMKSFELSMTQFELGKMKPSKYDYDKDVIPKDEKIKSLKTLKTFGYKGDNIDDLWNKLYAKEKLTVKQEKALDFLARLSLRYKAVIMLDAYKKQIIPNIKKVHAIQKWTKSGILDIKADWKKKGNTYIIDNKTTSVEYADDKADYSFQLTDYAMDEGCDKIMFIAIPKKIEKDFKKTCSECGKVCRTSHRTCPEETNGSRCNGQFKVEKRFNVKIKVVEGKVTEQMKQRVKEIRPQIQTAIDNKVFPCNFATCDNKWGKPCEYRELYWKDSMEGLEVVPDSKEKKK